MQTHVTRDGTHFLRLDRGEQVIAPLTTYVAEHNITAGVLTGVGALEEPTLRFFRIKDTSYAKQKFDGAYELLSLSGNVSLLDGKPWPHVHVTLGDDAFRCIGGHLEEATVGVTCEIVIAPADTNIGRALNSETGLSLWNFS